MRGRRLRRWLRCLPGLAAVAAGAQLAPAQVTGERCEESLARGPAAVLDSARALVRALMVTQGVPGLSVAVGVDTMVVWAEGFGLADLARDLPACPATRFRIGGISRPLTAAALARLAEDRQLDLDAPVQRYVTAFPDKGAVITPRLLAGHLGGIRHYREDEALSPRRYADLADGISIFKDDSLVAQPGTRFLYSSYGYNLLGVAIEGAAKRDFRTVIREVVLEPLGMRHTVAEHPDSTFQNVARFYVRDSSGVLGEAPYVDNSYKWPSGGFLSTAPDLVRLGLGHLRPGFLRPRLVGLLWTSQRTEAGEETGYGLGWWVGRDADDREVASHGGNAVGGTAILLVYRDAAVVVSVLANLSGARLGDLAREVARLWLDSGR